MSNNCVLNEREKSIHFYLKCAVNFYGAITPRTFLILFNKHNSPKLLKAEFEKYSCKLEKQPDKNYIIFENYIFNNDVNSDKWDEILYFQGNKKFYYPKKDELSKYVDKNYYMPTEQTSALINYLQKKYNLNPITADSFARKLSILSRMEESNQAQINLIEEFNLPIKDINETKELYGYMVDVLNHTKKWANCGFSPKEMHENL